MKNPNKPTKAPASSNSDASFTESAPSKRFKAENSPTELSLANKPINIYGERNERYMNDGVSQYTLQFLRKMANSPKSISFLLNSNISSRIYPIQPIFQAAVHMQANSHERARDLALVAIS